MSELVSKIKEIISNAIRYWEIRRVIYNAILVLIVIISGIRKGGIPKIGIDVIYTFFVLAIAANAFYCSAYVIDFFVQLSDFQEKWKKYRWILFCIGTALASTFAWKISSAIFRLANNIC